jgi:hypothetical protein
LTQIEISRTAKWCITHCAIFQPFSSEQIDYIMRQPINYLKILNTLTNSFVSVVIDVDKSCNVFDDRFCKAPRTSCPEIRAPLLEYIELEDFGNMAE